MHAHLNEGKYRLVLSSIRRLVQRLRQAARFERRWPLSVQPTGSFETTKRYVDETTILEITFSTENRRATLTDFMTVVGHAYDDAPSKRSIYRRISGADGTVELDVEFASRLDYARAVPELDATNAADVVHPGDDQLVLAGLPSPTVADGIARLDSGLGERYALAGP